MNQPCETKIEYEVLDGENVLYAGKGEDVLAWLNETQPGTHVLVRDCNSEICYPVFLWMLMAQVVVDALKSVKGVETHGEDSTK